MVSRFYAPANDAIQTTSTALSWTLMELTKHEDIQCKIIAELDRELKGEPISSYEQLEKLTYLTMVIKEGLRMYPPVPIVAVCCGSCTLEPTCSCNRETQHTTTISVGISFPKALAL